MSASKEISNAKFSTLALGKYFWICKFSSGVGASKSSENLYSEFTSSGYALLVLKVGEDMQIELQTKDDNVIPIRDKIWKKIVDYGIAEELYKEVCGA